MKPFIQTSIAAAVCLLLTAVVMASHYSEKHLQEANKLREENHELKAKATQYEELWLECQAENAPEMRGSYYDGDKLKFR